MNNSPISKHVCHATQSRQVEEGWMEWDEDPMTETTAFRISSEANKLGISRRGEAFHAHLERPERPSDGYITRQSQSGWNSPSRRASADQRSRHARLVQIQGIQEQVGSIDRAFKKPRNGVERERERQTPDHQICSTIFETISMPMAANGKRVRDTKRSEIQLARR